MTALIQRIARLAWPVLVGQWASMMFGVLDTVMTGHASAADLAAMGLSVTIYLTVFVGLMGVLHALIPILAQLFGAGRWRDMGAMWGQGVWLALALSGVGAVFLLFPGLWLSLSGEVEPLVRDKVQAYLRPPRCYFAPSTRWPTRCRGPCSSCSSTWGPSPSSSSATPC